MHWIACVFHNAQVWVWIREKYESEVLDVWGSGQMHDLTQSWSVVVEKLYCFIPEWTSQHFGIRTRVTLSWSFLQNTWLSFLFRAWIPCFVPLSMHYTDEEWVKDWTFRDQPKSNPVTLSWSVLQWHATGPCRDRSGRALHCLCWPVPVFLFPFASSPSLRCPVTK